MHVSRKCPHCGYELTANVVPGHCAFCLLLLGLGTDGYCDEVPIAEQPGDWIGKYQLLGKIDEGGCGVVYRAQQVEPVRREVAVKIIKLGMDTTAVIARFEAERQALAILDHANIAKVYDAGSTKTGRPYFVMELVNGKKITNFCNERKLTTKERLGLFVQVCRGIQHAHQKGIIHRDIKPSNILVTDQDGTVVPKIIDFGIAKATSEQRLSDHSVFTAVGQFIGTPAYMSPEQASLGSVDVDTRSDIYSLGALLYELLTGQQPLNSEEFKKLTIDAILRALRENEPLKPSARLLTLPKTELANTAYQQQSTASKLPRLLSGDLDWIVIKALEKERTHRYETANGLAMDIIRHLNNEPVSAGPPSKIYLLEKSIRRNKWQFAIGILLFVTLVVWIWGIQIRQAEKLMREVRQLNDVALHLWSQGNLSEAERDYRKVANIQIHVFGQIHPDVAETKHNLYLILLDEGQTNSSKAQEALNMIREVTNIQAHLPTGQTNSKVDLLLSQEFREGFNVTNRSDDLTPIRIDWWKCDGDAKDSIGNAAGTILGQVTPISGINNHALHFDGKSGFVVISNVPTPQKFSISSWVSFDSMYSDSVQPGLQYIIFRQNSHTNNFEAFSLEKSQNDGVDRLVFEVTSRDGYNSKIITTNAIAKGLFYHAVGTFDGTWLRFYVNGILQGVAYHPFPIDYDTPPLYFGSTGTNWDGHFFGSLEDTMFFKGTLSGDQVKALYELGRIGI